MPNEKPDFSGYATKYDVLCSDGRKIRKKAFEHQDGAEVPLVWQHQRNSPDNVLGKVRLQHRDDGVYCFGFFNSTSKAKTAKALLEHGDIRYTSIFANELLEKSKNVMHGTIREVSLVLAGANPGAVIENVSIVHSDGEVEEVEGEAVIFTDEMIEHSDSEEEENPSEEEIEHASDGKTAKDVLDSMNDEQKILLYAMVEHALNSKDEDEKDDESEEKNENGGKKEMKHSVFEGKEAEKDTKTLTHDQFSAMMKNATKYGSLRDAVEEAVIEHGITNIDYLFDEAQLVRDRPDMIARSQEWVAKVYDAASKSPFSHIKSMAANITMDEARAKGYIKGKKKTDEQFALLKRTTTPQTVYKKQSFDRDDIADITSFDVIGWVKGEMKVMLKEECARAQLIGDGRNVSSDDKINPLNIRPIYGDDEVYVVYKTVTIPANGDYTDVANAIIDASNFARIDYKGSGNPNMFTTSTIMTDMMLAKDKLGRRLYNTKAEVSSALRVGDIVEVPVLDNVTRTLDDGTVMELLGIIVNMKDYTVGSTKMGQTTMFDDFDIDYNKMKYLIETRMSGALTMPYSAICLERVKTAAPTLPSPPSQEDDDQEPAG